MEKEKSLRTRALLAVVLFFGFYLLSLATVAGLAFIAYLQWKILHSLNWRVVLLCLGGAGIILWSIAPRRDRFVPPGPRLTCEQNPRFFERIGSIARSIGGQRAPREVYLILDGNAWVASRGGFMGIGSRRVMAVGIPLLQTLSIPEFTAVLAHEFGHYYGGDVKLGPWIYKTRLAIIRTIVGLQQARSILLMLFLWYAKMFLKVTSSISRGQELAADRMAASVAGAKNITSALRSIDKISLAFGMYWQEDVLPLLAEGFFPPVVMGFGQYLLSEQVMKMMESDPEKWSSSPTSHPYDSHPALNDRLAALQERAREGEEKDSEVGADSQLALSLLGKEEPEIEQELLTWMQSMRKPPFTPISWPDVGERVWAKIWKEGAAQLTIELTSPATPADFPQMIRREAIYSADQAAPELDVLPPEVRRIHRIANKYGSALASAMIETGWIPEVLPGKTPSLEKGGVRFTPFESVAKLAGGELDEMAWRELCRDAGILDLRVGP